MARVRCLKISNFKGIKQLEWFPNAGINCLIGPGDSGKSTVLEAIDLCIGARRNIQFSDDDFYNLNVDEPILIEVTVGDLDESLKNFESYGLFLRGYDDIFELISDEPEAETEIVLTVQLKVGSDLEPSWNLFSERAQTQGQARSLAWGDRLRIAPARIGNFASYDLSWRKGSVMHRLSEERADASAVLAKVARDARNAFGNEANEQLTESRTIVSKVATDLGVRVGASVNAMLDSDSVSVGGGTISLHSEYGIPLKNLGTGSIRLLVAGLQRKASGHGVTVLIDELESGLEPHRIIRLLNSLGAKETEPPLQAFLTTHSPIALRELSGNQIFIIRGDGESHEVQKVGAEDDIQGTIRSFPEAFLAPLVIVCEGATEVGLLRGLDLYKTSNNEVSISANGVVLVDGGGVNKIVKTALSLQSLGYLTAIFRDDDAQPDKTAEEKFKKSGGLVFQWSKGKATEDEIFGSLSEPGLQELILKAVEFHGDSKVDENIKSASQGKCSLEKCQKEFKPEFRKILATAAKGKSSAWFKSISFMEDVAQNVIGPDVKASPDFIKVTNEIFKWTRSGRGK